MVTSEAGLKLIEFFEGLRLECYDDIVGKKTIGYGHLLLPYESYPNGISQDLAEKILAHDVSLVENHINAKKLSLSQNQFDALISFGFNLGVGSLDQLLSHGVDQVSNHILAWNHAGGKVVPALTHRRQAELELWNKS